MDSQNRQEYVRAAVSFLQNPKLVDSTLQDKLKFLKDKGLSQIEVDEALNLALINRHQNQGSKWNFLIVLGMIFGGYKMYQAYLESRANKPYQQVKQPQSQEKISLNDIMRKMTELRDALEHQRTNFQSEIRSIKTLLLGHEKFAAPPKIPPWQLKDKDEKKSTEANMQ